MIGRSRTSIKAAPASHWWKTSRRLRLSRYCCTKMAAELVEAMASRARLASVWRETGAGVWFQTQNPVVGKLGVLCVDIAKSLCSHKCVVLHSRRNRRAVFFLVANAASLVNQASALLWASITLEEKTHRKWMMWPWQKNKKTLAANTLPRGHVAMWLLFDTQWCLSVVKPVSLWSCAPVKRSSCHDWIPTAQPA